MDKTSLGDRMKLNYENRTRISLPRRTNTIIRLDGKAFHTYTKGLDRPYDEGLREDMLATTIYLCENIQGARCGYTQSDEISLLLTDYNKLDTHAWYDGNIQKITSISAAIATAKFNQLRLIRDEIFVEEAVDGGGHAVDRVKEVPLAFFDSRTFTIPEKEEVVNYFLWRQRDAERNSIQMLAQSLYSHKELHKKNTSELQDMCHERGFNWNNISVQNKRGSFVKRSTYIDGLPLELNGMVLVAENSWKSTEKYIEEKKGTTVLRSKWEYSETPMFSKDRESILSLMPQ